MKRVATIPAQRSFLKELAQGLWQQAEGEPLQLAAMQVFLPNRRACRELRTSFLQITGGRAALLPRLQPLSDIDEAEFYFVGGAAEFDVPQAVVPLRRAMLLTQLIRRKDPQTPFEQAAELAAALAKLLDQAQTEGVDFSALKNLVPDDLAQHWQETLQFLEIVTAAWPVVLKEEGALIDPAERRNRVLKAQARAWHNHPLQTPVIAAGVTGSTPAVAEMLDVIASLPQGQVVLPGLDQTLDEEAWQAIDEAHPQFGMKSLLEQFGVNRADVVLWPTIKNEMAPRVRLLQEAMRPASTTQVWRELKPTDVPLSAVHGLSRLTCDHQQEEADVIALRLREVLEHPARTAMLVTPDRALAARVAATLQRWGVEANDSAGSSLPTLPLGSFLNAVYQAAAPQAAAIEFLTLLKHPLTGCGVDTALCRTRARLVEVSQWRGLRRDDGWTGAAESLRAEKPELAAWVDQIAAWFAPITSSWREEIPLVERIRQHIALAEQISATADTTGALRLWVDNAGEAAATWLDDWQQAARDFPALVGHDYMRLCQFLMRQVTVRPAYGAHARINILGPLEARLQQADLVILGGLNEGVWPTEAEVDPWLSRPMQQKLHLPTPERRLGLAAHDFVQLASAPEVLLTRARRKGSAPTVPSRFLSQLEAVLQALGYHDKERDALASDQPWIEWARKIDEPEKVEPCAPPQPCPPVTVRPQKLSVTEIATWQRNPYAIYAKRILKLDKLHAIDEDVTAADHGTVLHKAFELFLHAFPQKLPEHALEKLLEIGREAFAPYRHQPQVAAFWQPRFERIAEWFIAEMKERQTRGIRVDALEKGMEKTFASGKFSLYGRADRIDHLADGSLEIIDYKTGSVPEDKRVQSLYEPQLPLLAALAQGKTSVLSYWQLKGGREIAKIQPVKGDVEELATRAVSRLENLVAGFAKSPTPYLARPKPKFAPRFDDYEHLARIAEWSVEGGDE